MQPDFDPIQRLKVQRAIVAGDEAAFLGRPHGRLSPEPRRDIRHSDDFP
jgi:hypothetical protein